jgi:hypothetical protein
MSGGGISRRGGVARRRARPRACTLGVCALMLTIAPVRADELRADDLLPDEEDNEVRDPWPGYTLDDAWDELWVRIMARGGRPDPDGPLLQRFSPRMGPRYQIDVFTQDFPMASEKRWAEQRTGARLWVRSLDALDLGMRLQLRTEIPTWKDGYLGLQFDQRQDWVSDLRALRFEVGHREIAGRGLDAALRVYPRFDKNDIDIEAITRARASGLGEVRLRVGAVDPFVNATFGAIESRGQVLDEHIWQVDVPLATSIDARTATFAGLRGEVYAGYLTPQRRRHRFPQEPEHDHLRRRQALLGAALLEWSVPHTSLALGATLMGIDARMDWEYGAAETGEADAIVSVHEQQLATKTYALVRPLDSLHVQASFGHTLRPEFWTHGDESTARDDREWMWSVRTMWMPTRVAGADVQYIGSLRRAQGPPELPVDGRANSIITRLMLELGDDVWASFGFGWGLDSHASAYDRGGMTLIWTPD